MDRSFLSQSVVIEASRAFVCIRLTTYEDKDENAFAKALFVGGSGDVENTVFTILSPDGKQKLIRAHRSPSHLFSTPNDMANAMNRIARQYEAKAKDQIPALAKAANVRMGLNVASCDHQPFVVLLGKDASEVSKLEERLRPLSWNGRFLGRFVVASTANPKDLSAVTGVQVRSGLLMIQPDPFGTKGTVLAQSSGDDAEWEKTLVRGLEAFEAVPKLFQNHVREGYRKGVFWETTLPVTDPMEARARERNRPK